MTGVQEGSGDCIVVATAVQYEEVTKLVDITTDHVFVVQLNDVNPCGSETSSRLARNISSNMSRLSLIIIIIIIIIILFLIVVQY